MNESERLLRSQIELALPAARRAGNWDDVVRRARRARGLRAAAVLALALVAFAVGTSALAETLGHGFSDWLTSAPGTRASSQEQQRFQAQNERSLAPFVPETDLRELIHAENGGRSYRLVGFRTGGAVCLRLEGTDVDEGGDVACVAADELAHSHELALPLKVDAPLLDRGPSSATSDLASFGLVAAETRRVVLVGDDGGREATVANGAFLSLAPGPVREHTTLKGFAFAKDGVRRPVALAPSLTDEIGEFRTGLPLRGPARVERTVAGGRIEWLERRESRGEPLTEGLRRSMLPSWPAASFARVILPDPDDFIRIILAVPDADPDRLCYAEVGRGGVGGSCAELADAFAERPFTGGWTYAGAGSQFVSASGIASDDVARLELFLGNGERRRVALRDNAFFVRAARAKFPARLVAYDAAGRVIGVDTRRAS